jgi:hypothetical protein
LGVSINRINGLTLEVDENYVLGTLGIQERKDVTSVQHWESVFFGFSKLVPQKLRVEHYRFIYDRLN